VASARRPFISFFVAISGRRVDVGLFHGYHVGCQNTVQISHLQFADDTFIIGEKNWDNVHSMSAMLILFEDIPGLNVISRLSVSEYYQSIVPED
jgi:hypothetical protein